jgi:hypothetical protein
MPTGTDGPAVRWDDDGDGAFPKPSSGRLSTIPLPWPAAFENATPKGILPYEQSGSRQGHDSGSRKPAVPRQPRPHRRVYQLYTASGSDQESTTPRKARRLKLEDRVPSMLSRPDGARDGPTPTAHRARD